METDNNKIDKKKSVNLILLNIRMIFLIGVFILVSLSQCFGQLEKYIGNMKPEYNFYYIQDKMNIYLDSLKTTMDEGSFYAGGGDYKEFKKFEEKWEHRVTEQGGFERAFDAEYEFYNNTQENYEYISTLPWSELGPNVNNNIGIGPVEFIEFYDNGTSQSTQYMLTGSLLSGLFYSTDFGETWNKTGTDALAQSGVSWAVFHPNDHENWFVANSGNSHSGRSSFIGRTGGVYHRTIEEGEISWTLIADKDDFEGIWTVIYKLVIDPINPNILYAVTSKGIFRTNESNVSNPNWIKLNTTSGIAFDLELKPNEPSTLYITLFKNVNGLNKWNILKSANYGYNWTNITPANELLTEENVKKQNITIEVSKARPNYLYCNARLYSENTFYYNDLETNNGWTLIGNHDNGDSYGDGHGFGVEQVTNGNEIIVSRGLSLKKYQVFSGTSNNLPQIVHVDVEDVVYHPYNPNEVWICSHGGVEKSINGGTTWQSKYEGLGVAQTEKFATSHSDPKHILAGLYHDGTHLTMTDYEPEWQPEWQPVYGGDGMKPLIDNKDPNNMWASYQKGEWRYTPDFFENYTDVGLWNTTLFITVGVLNKQNPAIFFRNKRYPDNNSFNEDVYRSTNRGLTSGDNEFISTFTDFLPANGVINILGLYSPYENGDYLIAHVKETTANNDEIWHLFRTTNANAESNSVAWEELSIPRTDKAFSVIEFDPDNSDKIYLSYAKSENDDNWPKANKLIYKVDYSNTANPIFIDITRNLPYTYVAYNSIAVEKGGDGSIYLATEFGVFYTNNELLTNTGHEWKRVGTDLPHVTSKGIEINYVSNRLRIATWGRGVWEIPLPCFTSKQELNITNNTIWNSHMRICRDVVIESGATLTIESDAIIAMATDAKIIVKPFAKLIINGAKITNACNDQKWSGIEVWGHYDDDQEAYNGDYVQGYLELNNCFIENAETAVYLGRPQYYEWNGGILKAENVTFKNNKIAVLFPEYHYRKSFPEGIIELNNISYVRYCSFSNDENYIEDSDFESHIKLESVKGISIKQSTFNSGGRLGIGIDAFDAGFYVSGNCDNSLGCTPEEWEYSSFTGYNMAIYTRHATGPLYSININHSIFDANQYGVYANQLEHVTNIKNSYFYVGKNANSKEKALCTTAYGRGIYICNSNNFHIEYNKFFLADGVSVSDNVIGIFAANNTSEYDVIYSNEFTGFKLANLAYETNRKTPGYDDNGLVYECNENTDNFIDFEISGYDHDLAKIHGHQGTEFISARNKYSSNTDPNAKHWRNMGVEMINYYVHSTENNSDFKPTKIDTYNNGNLFTIVSATSVNQCPDNDGYHIERTTLSPEEIQAEELSYSEAYSNFQAVETIFNDLKDGGSTEGTSLTIASAQPSDTWELRSNLLGMSPHLSKQVLIEASDRTDVLPNSVLLDVLAANPDELKKADLIEYLENKEEPLPDYMIDILVEVSTGTTYKTALINQMNRYKSKQKRAANTILTSLLNEEYQNFNLIRSWLDNLGGINADRKIVETYIQEGNYADATTLLNLIPDLYDLQGDVLDLFNDDKDVLQLQITLKQSGRSLKELTSVETAQLEIWASNNSGYARSFARNVLETHYGNDTFCDCVNRNENKSSVADFVFEEEKDKPLFIDVSPNPAKHYVEFSYELSEIDNEGLIIITDIYGKQIHSISVNSQKGIKIWDIRKIPTGSYIFTLKTKYFEQSGKLIIQ